VHSDRLRACPPIPKYVEESTKKSAETSEKSVSDSLSDAIDDGGRRGLRHVCANRCDLPVRAHNVSDPLSVLVAQHSTSAAPAAAEKSFDQSAPWACEVEIYSAETVQVCMPFVSKHRAYQHALQPHKTLEVRMFHIVIWSNGSASVRHTPPTAVSSCLGLSNTTQQRVTNLVDDGSALQNHDPTCISDASHCRAA
jgi:hypothetical protein